MPVAEVSGRLQPLSQREIIRAMFDARDGDVDRMIADMKP